jgi:hypothetical protein
MPAARTWTTLLACTVALAMSACGGAGTQRAGPGGEQTEAPAEGGSPPPEEVTFSSGDLCDLVLTEQDVPSGMSLADERDKPNECGVLFNNDGGPPVLISRAYLYADAEEAAAEAESLRDQDADAHEGAELIESPLGEASFGILRQQETITKGNRTSYENGYVAYYWRVGNVVQALTYDTGFTEKVHEGDALPLAEIMQARAEEL